jgi:hypothetical protein
MRMTTSGRPAHDHRVSSPRHIELEPYREVIDMLAARIKRTEQNNTYLSEAVAGCRMPEARGTAQ